MCYIYYNKSILVPFLFFVCLCFFLFFDKRNYKTFDVCAVFYLINLIYFYILDIYINISTELFFYYSFISFYMAVLLVVFNNPYFYYKIIKNTKSDEKHLMFKRMLLCFLLFLFLFVMPLSFDNNIFEKYLFFVVGGGMCFYLFLGTLLCIVFERLENIKDRKG